ncbi:hypothetical protein P872_11890 [Rhodonellum psychrophilum GCM71 = DSM 17998]|uniref:Uncharacterized protein n=2 Tax=Rhodonellum TaxID=336827 RepID=U5BW91_9BACT|nr:hypothetical protein P872_11890 [Rhodonellum psychrophilum GCM71 = DSM 17998]SDZ52570.1 hypothetical protein SAMN05444412_12037 [Rhodonellum ikkaensis]
MQIFSALIIMTVAYGLLILSVFPDKYLRKISHFNHHGRAPEHLKISLSTPLFLSFLGGYSLASFMLYFFVV